MGFIQRIKSFFGQGAEGSWRGPFFGLGHLGNMFEFGRREDGFQRDLHLHGNSPTAAKFAAVGLISDAISLMPGSHYSQLDGGGRQPITTSALSRWLVRPNSLQTANEFWSSGIRLLLETGNAVAYCFRNNRNEIVQAYWAASFTTHVIPDGDGGKMLYYAVNTTEPSMDSPEMLVPATEILHLRINADARNPLRGISPVLHCAMALAVNSTLQQFLIAYLNNRASPSNVLTTDVNLTNEQVRQLRAAWEDQAAGMKSGKTPILFGGLKPVQFGVAPGDDRLIENFKMSVEEVARAFRIPKAMLGIAETMGNSEQMVNLWLSTGLAALVDNIEQAVDKLFALPLSEGIEFDTRALTRMDWEQRVNSAAKGATSGVFSIDEQFKNRFSRS